MNPSHESSKEGKKSKTKYWVKAGNIVKKFKGIIIAAIPIIIKSVIDSKKKP